MYIAGVEARNSNTNSNIILYFVHVCVRNNIPVYGSILCYVNIYVTNVHVHVVYVNVCMESVHT